MNLCVIPARGGSKRIEHKNIRDFCGRPIIDYSIRAARDSGCFSDIIVSTDDAAIAEVATACGADVPFLRPAEIADDFTGTGAVTAHAIEWFKGRGRHFEYTCCLYATAPFITAADLTDGLAMLKAHPAFNFCFSAVAFPAPIQRALRRTEDGGAVLFEKDNYYLRSQDLEPAFHDAGQFYWGRTDVFAKNPPIFLDKSLMYILPRTRVEDIDTPEDWAIAEQKFRAL